MLFFFVFVMFLWSCSYFNVIWLWCSYFYVPIVIFSLLCSCQALLAANDPFLRGVEAEPDPEPEAELWVSPKARPATAAITSAATIAKSTVVPALCSHPAKHEVQAAVLHILNEEGEFLKHTQRSPAGVCLAWNPGDVASWRGRAQALLWAMTRNSKKRNLGSKKMAISHRPSNRSSLYHRLFIRS